MFGLVSMGSVVSICRAWCVLYSAGSGVKRVHVVLFDWEWDYLCVSMYVFPVGMMECLLRYVNVVFMSWWCRLRMSWDLLVHVVLECQMCIMLNSGGDRTPSRYELALCWCFVSECSLWFASSDVVWDECENSVWDVSLV